MNKKDWQKLGISVIVGGLLILVIVSVINFEKTKETIDVTMKNPITEGIEFQNESDMEEQEIRTLVENHRQELKDFFQHAEYYTLSEVSLNHGKEEDENFIVIGESFLNQLKELLTLELYTKYWDECREITPNPSINVKDRLYMARKDLFDEVYTKSAIATLSVNEENLVLKNATNEKIEALENIKWCEEDVCEREEYYTFFLVKEEDTWKISEFTNRY